MADVVVHLPDGQHFVHPNVYVAGQDSRWSFAWEVYPRQDAFARNIKGCVLVHVILTFPDSDKDPIIQTMYVCNSSLSDAATQKVGAVMAKSTRAFLLDRALKQNKATSSTEVVDADGERVDTVGHLVSTVAAERTWWSQIKTIHRF